MTELLLKLLDFLLAGFLTRRRRGAEFEALRQGIIYTSVVSNYPVELNKLRAFILKEGLIKTPAFEKFFHKWLASPWVERGDPLLNAFTRAEVETLREELLALRL